MSDRDLLQKLKLELFQTETSAKLHPRREAKRLGDSPAAAALLAVSEDGERSLAALEQIIGDDVSKRSLGVMAGHALSVMRQVVIDRIVDRERSYRGTLFGMHHGVDLVTLVKPLAARCGETQLVDWCTEFLQRRPPLVEKALQALVWFADHPDLASESGAMPSLTPHPRS